MNTHSFTTQFESQGPTFFETLKAYWRTVSLLVRFVLIMVSITYFLSWIMPRIIMSFILVPEDVIYSGKVWTLITTPFFSDAITVFLGLLIYVPKAIKCEMEEGTIRSVMFFIIHNLIIQLLFLIVVFLFSLVYKELLRLPSLGLIPFLISREFALLRRSDPEQEFKVFPFPVAIKLKFYTWALLIFYLLANMILRFDLLCGCLYGLLLENIVREKLDIRNPTVEKIEAWKPFQCLQKLSGKIYLTSKYKDTADREPTKAQLLQTITQTLKMQKISPSRMEPTTQRRTSTHLTLNNQLGRNQTMRRSLTCLLTKAI